MTSVRDEIIEMLASHCMVNYDDAKLKRMKTSSANKHQDIYASQSLRKSSRKQVSKSDEPLLMLSELAS